MIPGKADLTESMVDLQYTTNSPQVLGSPNLMKIHKIIGKLLLFLILVMILLCVPFLMYTDVFKNNDNLSPSYFAVSPFIQLPLSHQDDPTGQRSIPENA